MKISIKDIKRIEQGREIGQRIFIRVNSKQIEHLCKGVDKITKLFTVLDIALENDHKREKEEVKK